MMAMEIVTVAFPIYQILKHKRAAREMHLTLADFDKKRLGSSHDSMTPASSLATGGSLKQKNRGKMYSMEALDECLSGNYDSLQIYSSCMELNGENIIFLTKVIAFRLMCQQTFHNTCSSSSDFRRARQDMFRRALSIFVTLVHSRTATYPINIESPIYNRLEGIFGPATALVATPLRRTSSLSTTSSSATPWDEIPDSKTLSRIASPSEESPAFPMRSLSKPHSQYDSDGGNDSSEHIVGISEHEVLGRPGGNVEMEPEPLEGVTVSAEFDENVFDAAYKSIRYMVWSETWQRFMVWRAKAGNEQIGRAL